MERRAFLKVLAQLAAASAFYSRKQDVAFSQPLGGASLPARGKPTRVFLAGLERASSPQALKTAVRAAAESATDFSWLSKGDAVFIKPALNSGNPYPATTSPEAIGAVVEMLKDRGAGRVIVGDMCGIEHVKLSQESLSGSSRSLMEASGMARAATAAGAELHFFEEAGWQSFYEDFPAAASHWKAGLMMPSILKEVDHIILMPRCSRHVLAGSTLGLKAAVGYWRTDTRLEYHRDASTFQEKTAEGNTVNTLLKKQRLVLSTADKILTTFGPDRGFVFQPEIGLVMASESVVAHDMVSVAWLLENRLYVPSPEKEGFKDPYGSQVMVSVANHWVVNRLGGLGEALDSERLTRNDINTIWDDRVLNRAYQVFGNMPAVLLEPANNAVPQALKQRLTECTTPPA
jgi:uncharacterized protein (DUF362 family)